MFTFLRAYEELWLRILDFKGRSTRKDYIIANVIIFLLSLLSYILAAKATNNQRTAFSAGAIVMYAHLPAYIALGFRRFEDMGLNRWLSLFLYIPFAKLFAGALCFLMPSRQRE
jgi:uncharacterized membrane protein YhaH (DUF805 family)